MKSVLPLEADIQDANTSSACGEFLFLNILELLILGYN